jgi:outer membrane biosynthesis protein TonB
MRALGALTLLCLIAVSLRAQEKAVNLPTVSAYNCPKYPQKADSMNLQGMVRMEVTTDGHVVSDVKLVSGHSVLAPDAIKNVRTWKFAGNTPATFTVDYFYVFNGGFKRDPVTKCNAKFELPTKVTIQR